MLRLLCVQGRPWLAGLSISRALPLNHSTTAAEVLDWCSRPFHKDSPASISSSTPSTPSTTAPSFACSPIHQEQQQQLYHQHQHNTLLRLLPTIQAPPPHSRPFASKGAAPRSRQTSSASSTAHASPPSPPQPRPRRVRLPGREAKYDPWTFSRRLVQKCNVTRRMGFLIQRLEEERLQVGRQGGW